MDMVNIEELRDALYAVPVSSLDYQDWCSVGMALKHEGLPCDLWDDWSRADQRYHPGECAKKWAGFHGTGTPVTGRTIFQLAQEQGWRPKRRTDDSPGMALDWDDAIGEGSQKIVDPNWLEGRDLHQPEEWHPAKELIAYLSTLFESTENVGYVTQCWEKEGRAMPQRGCWDRTAGQLIEELSRCGDDIGSVLGDYREDVGAWIRFNPLDGKGVKNENVTEYRYALVESDSMPIEQQYEAITKLQLPIACLVHSGGKSLHAIVKVEAANYDEYRKRVDYLYEVCRKNGLDIDRQNRNPSRLSRMPGVMRKGNRQWLIGTDLGLESWAEWQDWVEGVNDDLPDIEDLSSLLADPPPKSPPLINGMLLQGHKMLISGPSKAGKSFALIELCVAIAEGVRWMGFPCVRGKVLYVNLELDRPSCIHRFQDVYKALGIPPTHASNIQIWNLRGKSEPMDKLAPKLIRRAKQSNFLAIVIDPIYKIITGDENSADQMARFCNQFDKVCTDLGCATIYCHHHSKGAQGGKKAMDRASGSGVFARDPDAILDLIQLPISGDLLTQRQGKAAAEVCQKALTRAGLSGLASLDDLESRAVMLQHCKDHLKPQQWDTLQRDLVESDKRVKSVTAWRLEGTLREFPAFDPINIWFDYPAHRVDKSGVLADVNPDAEPPAWKRNYEKSSKRAGTPESRKKDRMESIETAFEACDMGEDVSIEELAEYLGVSEKTIRKRIKEHGGFFIEEGYVGRREGRKKES